MKKTINNIKKSLLNYRKQIGKFEFNYVHQNHCLEILNEIDHFDAILNRINSENYKKEINVGSVNKIKNEMILHKKKKNYPSDIITDDEEENSFQNDEILKGFEKFGFRSVQLALVKHGKVPEFQIKSFDDKPLTFKDDCIQKANDVQNGVVIPEMIVLDPDSLKSLYSNLMKINENERKQRDLIICYWHKIPLIGIILLGKSLLSIETSLRNETKLLQ